MEYISLSNTKDWRLISGPVRESGYSEAASHTETEEGFLICSENWETEADMEAIYEEFRWNGDWNLCILDGLNDNAKKVMIDYLHNIMDEKDE